MPKAGKVTFIAPYDPIHDSGRLVVELLDDAGQVFDHVEIAADAITDEDQRLSVEIFAYNVDEARRKIEYREKHKGNDEMIHYELREDFDDWYLRQRRDRARHAGIDPKVLAEWSRNR
jgi:hypothetical protein